MSESAETALLCDDEEELAYDVDNDEEDRLLNEDDDDILELSGDLSLDEEEQKNRIDRFTSERKEDTPIEDHNVGGNKQNENYSQANRRFRGNFRRRGMMRGRGGFNSRGRGGQNYNNNNNRNNHYGSNNATSPKKCYVNPHFQKSNQWGDQRQNWHNKPVHSVDPWQNQSINNQRMERTINNPLPNRNFHNMQNRPLLDLPPQANIGGNSLLGNYPQPQPPPPMQVNCTFPPNQPLQPLNYQPYVAPQMHQQMGPPPPQFLPPPAPVAPQIPQNQLHQPNYNAPYNVGNFQPPPQQMPMHNYPVRPPQEYKTQFEPPPPPPPVYPNNPNNMSNNFTVNTNFNDFHSFDNQRPRRLVTMNQWPHNNRIVQQPRMQNQQKRPRFNSFPHKRSVLEKPPDGQTKQRKTYESASNKNLQVVITTDVKPEDLKNNGEDEDEETREYKAKLEEQKRLRARILAQKEENRKLAAQQKLAVKEGLIKPGEVCTKPLIVPKSAFAAPPPPPRTTNTGNRNDGVPAGFLKGRKVISEDRAQLPETMRVCVKNLASCTTEAQLRKLCNGIGNVQKFEMSSKERQATIEFNSVASAHAFYKKYQRFMLDLSMIQVELKT